MATPPGDRRPSVEERWARLASGESRGLLPALARAGLSLAAGPYWLGLKANLALYGWGLKRHSRPPLPVVSVGNLTLGGSGKTTAVRFLARLLAEQGLRPGIVLRGHRREGTGCQIVNDGRGVVAAAHTAGDEAAEYGRLLPGVPVAVGKRRETSLGLLRDLGVGVGLLDDGYQYFRMARDANIILISARTDLAARLFPRGIRREPWSHLGRATQVWITHADQAEGEELEAIRGLARRFAPGAPIVLACHVPCALADVASGETLPLGALAGRRVIALSGLGSPETFERTVRDLGADTIPLRFPDHHAYSPKDWRQAAEVAAAAGADYIVTTEKDAVKLGAGAPWPTLALRSELGITAGQEHITELVELLRERVVKA